MTDPDFGQREAELKRALASNRSLIILLFAGLVLVAAFAFMPCAVSKPGAMLLAGEAQAMSMGDRYSAHRPAV